MIQTKVFRGALRTWVSPSHTELLEQWRRYALPAKAAFRKHVAPRCWQSWEGMQIPGGWGGWGQGIPAALHPTGHAVAVPHHRAGTRAAPSAWRLSCHGSVWGTPLLRGRSIPIMAQPSRSHLGTSLQSPVPSAATVPSASCPHPPNPARRAVAGYCIWAVTNKNDINMLLSGGWEGCPEEQSRSVGASCPCQELGKWLPRIWPDHRSWGKRKDEKLLSPSKNQTGGDVRDLSESQFPSMLARLPLFSIIFSGPVSTGQRYTSERHCTREGYPSFESEKLGATRCQSLAPFHWAPLSFSSPEAWGARWPPCSSSWRRGQGAGGEWAHKWSVTAITEAWDVYPEQAWEVCRSKKKVYPTRDLSSDLQNCSQPESTLPQRSSASPTALAMPSPLHASPLGPLFSLAAACNLFSCSQHSTVCSLSTSPLSSRSGSWFPLLSAASMPLP